MDFGVTGNLFFCLFNTKSNFENIILIVRYICSVLQRLYVRYLLQGYCHLVFELLQYYSVEKIILMFIFEPNIEVFFLQGIISLASHAGVFRGARFSSLPTNACSTGNNIPFPLFYLRGKRPINSCAIKC